MASKPETPATEPKEKPKIGRRPDPKPEASPEQSLDNKKAPESKSTLKDLPASTEDSTNVDKGNASGWKRGVAPPNKDPDGSTPSEKPSQRKKVTPTAAPAPAQNSPAAILMGTTFIIRTVKHDGMTAGQVTGSILSQSLSSVLAAAGRTDYGTFTLAALRKLAPGMSRYPMLEKFCTASGTLIDDESISLADYYTLEDDPATATTSTPSSTTPSLRLYFRSTKLGQSAGTGANGAQPSTVQAPSLATAPSVVAKPAPEVGALLQKSAASASLLENPTISSGADGKNAGSLTESDWATVLRNCGVFYGWIVDPSSKRIVRAPKPAFRLRSKVDSTDVAKIPDFAANTAPPFRATGVEDSIIPESMLGVSTPPPALVPAEAPMVRVATTKTNPGIPNFRINDDSKIEITAHEHELTVSMAKSDFSEQSTEASVSGGGYGVSVGVSAGFASSKSDASKKMNSSKVQTLIARYMFPRCDLLMWPDEMEPTEELAGLIEIIRKTRSIQALRKLQAEYGQLFCQRTTLGARLLSTKTVTMTEQKTMEEHKESFKTSVGASVSASVAGFSMSASVKHEEAKGSTTVNETSQASKDENVVFEAVGGDTILANNPSAWCTSVGSFLNWRIINRDGLSSLVEILSAMPGYEAVQSWFVQAVPALSQYMALDAGHECKARLRVTSPTNSLSIQNAGNNASYYLGHDAGRAVTPRLNAVNTRSDQTFWFRVDVTEDIPIFNPPTYRAPTILGYDKFDVEGTPYGAAYNAAFLKTEWTIISPFDDELKHGTRIILRATAFVDPNAKPQADGVSNTPNVSHMVVFRNAQGEFLPAMSDSDEYQFWRILKTDTSQQYIKPGDEVRLAWDFRDQTTGWRDFTQDVFGRRQVSSPSGYGSTSPLFLKVPWPRFETSNNPTAMIMSSEQGDLSAKVVNINNKDRSEAVKYCLQDLKFRIDQVTNKGHGDADEYLISKLRMEGVNEHVSISNNGFVSFGQALQIRSSIFWCGIKVN